MKKIKKLMVLSVLVMLIEMILPKNVTAQIDKIEEILANMSNEEKIAQMIMPSFREGYGYEVNYDNITDIISSYNFAGVILFSENTPDIESTMRFVDFLQSANKEHVSRLLIAIDQEGGSVTRLGIGTTTPGNMALAATNDPTYAFESASIIGKELKALGINTNFAPVVDINNNPSNPVIGIRSFSDDANTVANYSEEFMKGLQSEGIITSLKHFPGHGDTLVDTHTDLSIINKSYDELKNNELIPFQKLIDSGTEMIMTAHIQFPQIETNTYVSKKDNEQYTLPATLSKTILTDILRNDMHFNGVIVTDALDMAAIAENFELEDASIRAINAGADILLMPYTFDSEKDELKQYIKDLALKVGTEIDEENVNNSVRRILRLKEKKGLLDEYDNSNLESDILSAKTIVSSLENHNEQFEIAKKAVTMVKNDNNILPLDSSDKTIVLYEYSSHIKSVTNAIAKLKNNGIIENGDNISTVPLYEYGEFALESVKSKITGAKNVVIISSVYDEYDFKNPDYDNFDEIFDYVHENGGNVIILSAQLPYDAAKYLKADAIILTYFANGIRFDLSDYDKEIPKYGPNVIAGLYMLFSQNENISGVLPVDIYGIDENKDFTNEIIFKRGFGLKYLEKANTEELEKLKDQAKEILNSNKEYSEESLNELKNTYDKVLKYYEENTKILENKQDEIDSLALELQKSINNLKAIYKIIDGNNQVFEKDKDITIKANGNLDDLVRLEINGSTLESSNYTLESGSTIAILSSNYLSSLSAGKYTLTFVYNDGSVDAKFTIEDNSEEKNNQIINDDNEEKNDSTITDNIEKKVNDIIIDNNEKISNNNPKTGDNVVTMIMLLGLSTIGLVVAVLYTKMKRFN